MQIFSYFFLLLKFVNLLNCSKISSTLMYFYCTLHLCTLARVK